MRFVTFQGVVCEVRVGSYSLGKSTSLQLVDYKDKVPYATATVNVSHLDGLEKDEVAIKNYSENAGMLGALMEAKIIHPPYRYIHSGYVAIPVCHLTDEFMKEEM